ncbi:MAG: hypothetical protein ABR554_07670 [Pyrinomonadaceae bacterium]
MDTLTKYLAVAAGVAVYERFEESADLTDPTQLPGAPRDIRDSTIEPALRADDGRNP